MKYASVILALLFATACGERERPMSVESPSQGYSLHIGVNKVDKAHYGSNFRLLTPERNASLMQKIARERGFATTAQNLLLTKTATTTAVQAAIRQAAKVVKPGGTFLLTYSGHGSQVRDESKDETKPVSTRCEPEYGYPYDERDETWCLYDRMMLDDELHAALGAFEAGVHIVLIVDSCHSGSPLSVASMLPFGARRDMLIEEAEADAIYKRHAAQYLRAERAATSEAREVRATVVALTACHDKQRTLDGPNRWSYSHFTGLLKDAYERKKFDGSLRELHKSLLTASEGHPLITPGLSCVGTRNEQFETRKPTLVP